MNIRGIVLMRDLLLLAIHRTLQGRCLSDPRNTLTHTAAERQSSPNTVSRVDQLQSRGSQPDRAILDCGLGPGMLALVPGRFRLQTRWRMRAALRERSA